MKPIVLLCCVTAAALIWRAEGFPTGDPPMFTAVLEDLVVADTDASGDPASFSLQCQVTGNPTPIITWFRQGNVIEGATGATLTVNPIVAGTDATTAGVEYYCEASNSFGTIRSRRASVQLATFGAWTVSGTRTIDARLGFSVAIPCTPPMANPAPIVFWQANDTNLPAGDPLSGGAADRVQVLPSGHLVIHALVAADFTPQYRCSVSNARTHTTSQSPQTFTLNQVSVLAPNPEGTSLHVFNHMSEGQAERGRTFYIFNVVQPTVAADIFSNGVPSIALRNRRDFYIVKNVEVSDGVLLEVMYFADGNPNVVYLGSLTTNISVIDPATVTSVSRPHRVLTGRRASLTCNIKAIPDANVMWYKDGILITSGTSRSISTTPDTNTQLIISSATSADNGMYQCVVSNAHGDDVGTISLQVRDHELEIVQGLARETPFLEGDKRTLTVIVRSDTEPTMTWSVNGQELTSSNSTYMIGSVVAGSENARGLTDYSISLSVFFLNTTYQGEYRLVAEVPSDGLVVTTTGSVLQERLTSNVLVELVDSPCLVVGTNVTLRCQPDGVPRSQVTWFRDNIQLMPSNPRYLISNDSDFTITIINVVRGDAGFYTCNAMNTLTNGTVSETRRGTETFGIACVPPTIAQVTDDSVDLNPMLMEGETLSLTCSTKGTPRPRIVWYRGDSRIGISSRTQINKTEVGDTILKSILVISSVVVSDSGTYECRVENIASTTSLQYQVVVMEKQVTCMAYSGQLCSAVFASSPANISSNLGSAFRTVANTTTYGQIIEANHIFYNNVYSKSCLEYLRFIQCLYLYKACPGLAWCGSNSKEDLKNAIANTCGCADTYSCIVSLMNVSAVIDRNYFEGSSSIGIIGGGQDKCQDVVTGVQCPPRCTHKYCSKRARNSKVCSLPGLGSCTGACKVTSCGACYYNDAPREIPSGCQQRCNGLTGQPLQRCLNRWGVCIRKRYKMLYSKDQTKRKRLFKCFEHPC